MPRVTKKVRPRFQIKSLAAADPLFSLERLSSLSADFSRYPCFYIASCWISCCTIPIASVHLCIIRHSRPSLPPASATQMI